MSKADFLDEVRSARAELREILSHLDPETLAQAKVPELEWTAKDVLSHLIGYDQAIVTALAEIRAGHKPTWPWTFPNFDPWNESNVAPRRARSFTEVLAELEGSRATLLGELEGWPDAAGPFGADTWDPKESAISWLGSHEREHAEMIAKLGARPNRRPG